MDKLTLLNTVFGFPAFRKGQEVVIDEVLNPTQYGILAIRPTGGGKSLLYQLPALMMEGLTIVISPLISLMKDQVIGLQNKGVKASFYNSSLTEAEKREVVSDIVSKKVKILYVAPERFEDSLFTDILTTMDVSLVAIDEAHCISSWGHGFRPSYRKIGKFLKAINPKQAMALTATATPQVQTDICVQLGFSSPKCFIDGFHRTDLACHVVECTDTFDRVIEEVEEQIAAGNKTGLIYCSTRKLVYALQKVMSEEHGIKCEMYHAELETDERNRIQEEWIKNGGLIVATNALGMGVDRSDVRFVYHMNMPGTIEALYQEWGRASRDGKGADCILFTNLSSDIRLQHFFIDIQFPPTDQAEKFYEWLLEYSGKKKGAFGTAAINMTQERMAEAAGIDPQYVGGCVAFLKKFGAIETIGRGKYEAKTERNEEIRWDLLEKKRRDLTARLNETVKFVKNTKNCRMLEFINYFGDFSIKKGCGKCDVCQWKKK
jgi:ATP-dependent DNA helicase RecQ